LSDQQRHHTELLGEFDRLRGALEAVDFGDIVPVAAVAEHVDRSVHATETLLARARIALRRFYREETSDDT
jgi:RNA polymerase sigma-70 factor (ECF subfamily)